MKVLFLKPSNLADHIQPSLGFGYLATQIRKDHDVAIYDCIKENTPDDKITEIVRRYNPDVIGMSCYTCDVQKVYSLLEIIRKNFPGKVTVVGGAHISALPKEGFEQFQPYLDYGFQCEGEIGFPKLLAALRQGKNDLAHVEGLIWRDRNQKVVCNQPAFVEDLDRLGFPAWDLMPPETYPESQHGAFFEKFPIAPIVITRGCPYACTFCSAPKLSGRKIRRHSVEYVQKHIQLLYERGVREIHIVDDNFTFDRDYCKKVLQGIIDLKLDISLATPNGIRMDHLDDEILDLMKEAGQYLITVAFESGTNRILKKMKKGTTVEAMREKVGMIKRHGFPIAGFFIIGYPTETREEINETIRFAKGLGLVRANFFCFLPLPGTESYQQLVESGEISKVSWHDFFFMTAPYSPQGISRQELLRLQRKAFLSVHLRPNVFLSNILAIKSFRHFKFLLRRFYHWVLMGPKNEPAQ